VRGPKAAGREGQLVAAEKTHAVASNGFRDAGNNRRPYERPPPRCNATQTVLCQSWRSGSDTILTSHVPLPNHAALPLGQDIEKLMQQGRGENVRMAPIASTSRGSKIAHCKQER
jgi:hypothetical protein